MSNEYLGGWYAAFDGNVGADAGCEKSNATWEGAPNDGQVGMGAERKSARVGAGTCGQGVVFDPSLVSIERGSARTPSYQAHRVEDALVLAIDHGLSQAYHLLGWLETTAHRKRLGETMVSQSATVGFF